LPLSWSQATFCKEMQNGRKWKEMEVLKALTRKQEQAQRAASSRPKRKTIGKCGGG
jgi:hypothetical protein